MSAPTLSKTIKPIVYPDSDGQPMADNTLQFRWIVTIEGGLEALFADNPNIFVAGDLLWYPVEGAPKICQAPDVLTVFGRPKGYRGSYKQWEEGGIPPQVVWEIMSPNNTVKKMIEKFQFYEKYGVEEYYVFDPEKGELSGWVREGERLKDIPNMQGWVSPRLRVRMEILDGDLVLTTPQGRPFATYIEVVAQCEQAERERERAERERERAERERERAEREKELATREKEKALLEVEKLRAQLRALGVPPET